MSFISNSELRKLHKAGTVLVHGIHEAEYHEMARGAVEAASIKLKVGEIFQHEEINSSPTDVRKFRSLELEQGDMAFVVTKEEICLPPNIGALMFSKSGGLAERGILITNTGHIDPGYSGKLRYAVVNMGNARFQLNAGDYLVKVMFFSMYESSSPHWGNLHEPIKDPDATSLSQLGKSLAAIRTKVEEQAKLAAREEFSKRGLDNLLITAAASTILSILATVVTINLGLMPMMEKRLQDQISEIETEER